MKRLALLSLAALFAVTGCRDVPDPAAPDRTAPSFSSQAAQDGYIVVFEPGVQDVRGTAEGLVSAHGGALGFVYEHALQGFSARLSAAAAGALARNPSVAYVEEDRVRTIFAQTVPTGVQRIFADDNDNIDIDGSDDYRVDVDVAIIDTGIDFEHVDLNVVGGVDCSGGGPFGGSCESGGDDDHYHGTHVAGSVAAIDDGDGVVGVAPGARLWAVKVLDQRGSGYTSWIVAGIDWVAANADKIEVANMSLGGSGFSQSEYDAIQGAVDKGVAFAVAAGNSNDDAKNYSPAAFDNVLTVSALADFDGEAGGNGSPTCRDDQDDTLADFSNWGSAVQIAAPGVCILSTFPIEEGEYGTISGTSMASPHAAGALALLASSNNPSNASDVNSLYDAVVNAGNSDWTDDSGDRTKEPLLDVSSMTTFAPTLVAGGGDGGGGDTNSPPSAEFTYACTELSCDFDGSGSSDSDGSISSYDWDFGDGNTGSGSTVSHTYGADGTYTVTLTVTDDGGATDTASQDVSVSSSDGGGESASGIHVGDLDGSSANNGSTWTATVTVTVHDTDHTMDGGSTVSFDYTGRDVSGSDACTTDSSGTCTFTLGGIPKRTGSLDVTVAGISDADGTYSAVDNHDPDGDSDGTTITVNKP